MTISVISIFVVLCVVISCLKQVTRLSECHKEEKDKLLEKLKTQEATILAMSTLEDKVKPESNKDAKINKRDKYYKSARSITSERDELYDKDGTMWAFYSYGKDSCTVLGMLDGSNGKFYDRDKLVTHTWESFKENFPEYLYLVYDWEPSDEDFADLYTKPVITVDYLEYNDVRSKLAKYGQVIGDLGAVLKVGNDKN